MGNESSDGVGDRDDSDDSEVSVHIDTTYNG